MNESMYKSVKLIFYYYLNVLIKKLFEKLYKIEI